MKRILSVLILLLFLTPCAADKPLLVLKLNGIYGSFKPILYRYELVASGDNNVLIAGSYRKMHASLSSGQLSLVIKKVQAVAWKTLPGKIGKEYSSADFGGTLQVEYTAGKTRVRKRIRITIGKIKDRALLDLLRTMMGVLKIKYRLSLHDR